MRYIIAGSFMLLSVASTRAATAQDPYAISKSRADSAALRVERLQQRLVTGAVMSVSATLDSAYDAYGEALHAFATAGIRRWESAARAGDANGLRVALADFERFAQAHLDRTLRMHTNDVQFEVRLRAGAVQLNDRELRSLTPAQRQEFRRYLTPQADSGYRRRSPALWSGAALTAPPRGLAVGGLASSGADIGVCPTRAPGGLEARRGLTGVLERLLPAPAMAASRANVGCTLGDRVPAPPFAIGGAVAAACIVGGSVSLGTGCLAAIVSGGAGAVSAYNSWGSCKSWCNRNVTKWFGARKACKAACLVAFAAALA